MTLADRVRRARLAHEAGNREEALTEVIDLVYELSDRIEGLAIAASDGNDAARYVLERATFDIVRLGERIVAETTR